MSGKRPTDHLEPSAKKRGSDRQLTKDDDLSEEEEEAVGGGPGRGVGAAARACPAPRPPPGT